MRHVEQQHLLKREKRAVIHDKQIELPIRHFEDKSVYQRVQSTRHGGSLSTKDQIPSSVGLGPDAEFTFNDPYFKDQWYLVRKLYIHIP